MSFYFLFFLISTFPLLAGSERIGIYAVHIPTGKVLKEEDCDKSFIPASCLKVVTTAAALHLLQPQDSFQTHLAYTGHIDSEGTLQGSLYIIGGGDPCLGSDRISKETGIKNQITLWTLAVKQAGIKKIQGQVIADASVWEKEMTIPSWSFEDVGNYYGAGACGLSFHENSYTIFFKPGLHVGDKTTLLYTEPFIPDLSLENHVLTGPALSGDQTCIYGIEFCNLRFIQGSIPIDAKTFTIRGSIPNPPAFAAKTLALALKKENISIIDQSLNIAPCPKTMIHTTNSPSIETIIFHTNQKSINLYAEHLLKKLGNGTTQGGIEAIRNFWSSQGIDLTGFYMADGSGLSRKNLITTKQLVDILSYMYRSPYFSIFLRSLPEIRKDLQAKSGSMAQVRGYVGYKKDIAFAILLNQCLDLQKAKEQIEAFFSELDDYLGDTNTSKI